MSRFSVTFEEASLRLDQILCLRYPDYSRTYFQELIESKRVLVNQKEALKRYKPKANDIVDVFFIEKPPLGVTPQNIALDILYEDDFFLAINKPAGMCVHPAPGNPDQTFANALLFYCEELEVEENSLRPGIVHRLDKETSGILLGAKTRHSHEAFSHLFARKEMHKEYIAITIGKPQQLITKGLIGRDPRNRQKMALVEKNGKESLTTFEILSSSGAFSLVKALPSTGRTHQIRVHLQSVKAPILGDKLYSPSQMEENINTKRQMLHARALSFVHPFTNQLIQLIAPLPEDMSETISKLSLGESL